MSHIIRCVLGGIVMSLMGVSGVNGALSSDAGLILDVKCKNVQDKITDEFAVNEPVWLSVGVCNTNSAVVSLWVDNDGVTCRPIESHDKKIISLPRNVILERSFKKVVLNSGQTTTVDVLLGDFLQVSETGTLPLQCSVDLRDDKGQSVVICAVVRLRFKSGLNAQGIKELVDRLRKRYTSDDEETRIRMVKSALSVPSSETIEFLTKSMSDDSERVQFAALDVLIRINVPKEQVLPLIQKATQSDKESVRRRATIEIEKHRVR